jgi:hypothetical protein
MLVPQNSLIGWAIQEPQPEHKATSHYFKMPCLASKPYACLIGWAIQEPQPEHKATSHYFKMPCLVSKPYACFSKEKRVIKLLSMKCNHNQNFPFYFIVMASASTGDLAASVLLRCPPPACLSYKQRHQ